MSLLHLAVMCTCAEDGAHSAFLESICNQVLLLYRVLCCLTMVLIWTAGPVCWETQPGLGVSQAMDGGMEQASG